MEFKEQVIMEDNIEDQKNNEFYSNCTAYFEFLRHKSKTDYEFEDEYYFTMPAISSK
ncbi:MAG: hypothetical protein OEQ12_05395 [Nitrosopumilus sp.]|nr:hypothetical protein [Nitrosopumilus sp.]